MPEADRVRGWLEFGGAPARVLVGVSTRRDGQSTGVYAANNLALHVGDDPERVVRNRTALQHTIGAAQMQWLQQVHGTRCVEASSATTHKAPEADAAWTCEAGLALAIMTADCVPVMMWAEGSEAVGAAHAGWRGLVDGVLESLVAAMSAGRPEMRLHAWIGPCIGASHYEVGEDVWSHFIADGADYGVTVVRPHPQAAAMAGGKRLLDLAAAAQLRLQKVGVESIHLSGLCSYADERFYSHRQMQQQAPGQQCGRMASVIMLHP